MNYPHCSKTEREALDYARALLNILEDFGQEQRGAESVRTAMLNILEDSAAETTQLQNTKSAVLNILEDLALEKDKLELSESIVRESLREKDTLLKEVHHRVKNNLQVIASLLRLQSRYLPDDQSRVMFEESQNRVHSISLVHEMLYQAGDLSRIQFGDYLLMLTRNLSESWRTAGGDIALTVEAEGVQLAVDTAIPCGLIVNELVTNALKHAFPKGSRAGSIKVAATWEAPGRLKLEVCDDGIGLPENVELRRSGSLGLELVSSLVRQLRATVVVHRSGGTRFEIVFPLNG